MIKTIYIYWPEGLDKAPDIITQCVQSWTHYNPEWTIVHLDNTNLDHYVPSMDIIHRIRQMYKDTQEDQQHIMNVLSLQILATHGGAWVDATVFCNQSLDEWTPIYAEEGFFGFDKPGPDRLLSNWFLYAEPSNVIIQRWNDAMTHFYSKRVQDWRNQNRPISSNFIPHSLFNTIYVEPAIQQSWNRVHKIPANGLGPHYILEQGMFSAYDQEFQRNVDTKIAPMYKLSIAPNYKSNCKPGTKLFYLLSTVLNVNKTEVKNPVSKKPQPQKSVQFVETSTPSSSPSPSPSPTISIDLSKIVLILTSTVRINTKDCVFQRDPKQRVQIYVKSIEQWLSNTMFNIVLVENSGYPFHELAELMVQHCDRFEYLTFDEKKLPKDVIRKHITNKGVSELYAIQYAFRRSVLAKTANFFIKITGRFFIPGLEEFLDNLRVQEYVALSQNNPNRCEMVGARRDMMNVIFNQMTTNKKGQHIDVEDIYRYRLGQLPQNKVIVCKEFEIEPTQRGGVKQKYTTI